MKRFKIIALFLLMFSFGFSEEGSQEEKLQARVTQLEQQIETQNQIIARYERLEDKLNDRVLETLDLNNKVDDFYNSAWNKLQEEIDRKINWILGLVAAAFGVIGIIAIMPIYQSFKAKEIFRKIETQEKKLEKYRNLLVQESNSYKENRKIGLEKDKEIEMKIYHSLGEVSYLSVVELGSILEKCLEKYINYYLKKSFEYCLKAISYFIKAEDMKGISKSLATLVVYEYIFEKRDFKYDRSEVENIIFLYLTKYSKEYTYINENLKFIFDEKKGFWVTKNRKKLKRLFNDYEEKRFSEEDFESETLT